MPDYSGCTQYTCERKGGCARYLMIHGRRQTVSSYEPQGCTAFWPKEKAPFALHTLREANIQATEVELGSG